MNQQTDQFITNDKFVFDLNPVFDDMAKLITLLLIAEESNPGTINNILQNLALILDNWQFNQEISDTEVSKLAYETLEDWFKETRIS